MNYLCVCDRGQVNRWNKQVWEEDREEKYWKWLWKEMMWEEREQVLSYLRSHGKHHGGKKITGMNREGKGGPMACSRRGGMNEAYWWRERERDQTVFTQRERERERGRGGMGGSPEQKGGGGFIWPTDWSGNVGTYWWVKGGDGDGEDREREREDVMKISWMQYQIALQNLIWNMAVKEKYPPICTLNKVINK